MLRPTAIKVFPLDNYKLKILFDNDEIKIFDAKPYIKGNWYGELADLNYFQSVFTNGYTIEWTNGQDICPDELYYNSILLNKIEQEAPDESDLQILKEMKENPDCHEFISSEKAMQELGL